jgi:hypothetical protein
MYYYQRSSIRSFAMNTVFRQLLSDKRIWLGPLARCRDFRDLVEYEVPDIIFEHRHEVLTFELYVQLQHEIATALAQKGHSKQNKNIALSLAGHKNKSMFLAVHNTNEHAYCQQVRGMSASEYKFMERGKLTVGELYRKNPTAFLGPLLPKNGQYLH